ncbi:c-type cytochrome biogenesis protein CcsB [Microbacterium esteraromaticum]|uniref:c-type cytochrome biogenesis protein CcsB n=1 Tax=Microbacterium esteraromaticum TaxID=57043 RepID=UPI001A9075A9|nr:c-type cytochrome biogenesis protein CcsB [Microbacterium esteraromaticum]MBN8424390.1 c-type cytochrome biogenesis protein CcsB [Microbacterium esteraromaticum]
MTLILDEYSLLTVYTAMAVYTLAFVVFAIDVAKRSARVPAAGTVSEVRQASADGGTTTLQTTEAEPQKPRYKFERIAFSLVVLGWGMHTTGVVLRGLAQGFVPWANMYEFSLISSAIVIATFIVMQLWHDLRFLGVYITGFTLVTLGVATVNLYVPVKPLPPVLDSYWLIIHVFVASLGTALFALSAGLAIVQLLQARREAGKKSLGFLKTFPDVEKLENLTYLTAVIGFVFWTFTLIAGSIWAERSWGRYWGWDTKEVWTFIIWIIYAGYIHARATRGWRGTRSAWLAIIGFAAVLFNYGIVNVFIPGLHSYSGL